MLDLKLVRQRPRYYVKWTGYSEDTWEPAKYDAYFVAVDIFHQWRRANPAPCNVGD